VLKYLNGTKHLKLMLIVENLGLLKWYVDGSHNVHWDCKGHGGAIFTMGRGSASSYSRKIKLNTRSSMETELLAADMLYQKCCGRSISYKHRATSQNVWGSYIKTISAASC
jgi:hypothetical protein